MRRNLPCCFPQPYNTASLLILTIALAPFLGATAQEHLPIPFEYTGDLYLMDSNCDCILQATPGAEISIAVTRAEILAATGRAEVDLSQRGLAFDYLGNLFFTEAESDAILKRTTEGNLSILISRDSILAAMGVADVDLMGMAFATSGFLYVVDGDSQSVLGVDPAAGTAWLAVRRADLAAVGATPDIGKGIVGGQDGLIYLISAGNPDLVYSICSDGTIGILTFGNPLNQPGGFATRAPAGDLLTVEAAGRIVRITSAGLVSTFLTKAQIEGVLGGPIDAGGAIAFDGYGAFYFADPTGGVVLQFDEALAGQVWVTDEAITAVTGMVPHLDGGIGFAPQYKLYFAQFGDGLGVLASEIILVSLDPQMETRADVILKGQDDGPLQVDLNGAVVNGLLQNMAVPAQGKLILTTDGEGDLVVGSVTICSNKPLAGVIVFSGTVGLAGVQSSAAQLGFLAPIKALGLVVQTGIAVMNLEELPVRLTLELVGDDGEVVATAEVILAGMGQLSAFVNDPAQFPWDQAVDFSDFNGTLRAAADGWVAATVVQTRPDQFATQPVAPNDFRVPVRELLLPFRNTGDLIALDDGCECVLRITKEGDVSVEITRAEILAVTNGPDVDLDNEGIAFDTQGALYFIESETETILKRPPGGQLFVLTTEQMIVRALGVPATEVDLDGMVFGSDGFLYVTDDRDENEAVLKINPQTGFVTVAARKEDFLALLPGGSQVDVEKGIAAGPDRDIWVFSDGTPDAVFRICANGEIALVRSGFPFQDPDQFATRAPNGDILIVDDGTGDNPSVRILRISQTGEIETFLSHAQLQAALGATPDGDGGIAFDSKGNFFYAAPVFGVFRFDQEKSSSTFVSVSAIRNLTGVTPVFGGIAFEPEYKLYFAQFGDGLGVLASEIILVSLDGENPTTADVILKGQDGSPLSVDLNGQEVLGLLEDVVIPADGKVVLETDGEGDLVVGSVTIYSNRPLAGVIVFSGTVGLAGVQSSEAQAHFVAPIKALGNAIKTGLAVMNLEEVGVRLSLELLGADGELVATAEIILEAMGQLSAFVDETDKFPWSAVVDFSNFEGTLKAWAEGWVGATVVQTRPDQFATQPVAGLKEENMP